jgi:hypothetical protein
VRTRAAALWRVDPEHLEEAQRDAAALAVYEQERLGLDIVTDGEVLRESCSNRFACRSLPCEAERLYDYRPVGLLDEAASREALVVPARDLAVHGEPDSGLL